MFNFLQLTLNEFDKLIVKIQFYNELLIITAFVIIITLNIIAFSKNRKRKLRPWCKYLRYKKR